MARPMIHISQPVTGTEEWEALRDPLESGWLTSGPKTREFEKLFAEKHQVEHAISTTSATTALHLSLVALGIGPGDEVIVPAFTWVASANVVLHCGATPVFVDIQKETYNIDPVQIHSSISSKTKAIIAVHLFGLCADMDAIAEAAPGIPIIEDAACAVGASYKNKSAGSLGTLGCFSFHPRKIITTGEGGMITTNDSILAETLIQLKNHGATLSEEQRHHGPKPYLLPVFDSLGYNYRMTDLQGAVGVAQLKKLDSLLDERKRWAAFYRHELSTIPWLDLPAVANGFSHSWQSYVTFVNSSKAPYTRNEIMERLLDRGISTRPGTHAVHMLEYYVKKFKYESNDFPIAKLANDQSVAIPLHNRMSREDYLWIVDALQSLN